MSDLIDGTINGWPVSLMIERGWQGAPACGAHCCAYTREGPDGEDESAPDEITTICYAITDACPAGPPSKSLRTAVSLGFIPDKPEN